MCFCFFLRSTKEWEDLWEVTVMGVKDQNEQHQLELTYTEGGTKDDLE
jgi:hypothetical protein